MILALVGYQFYKCKFVFSLIFELFVELSSTTLSKVVFSTKFFNRKTLGGIYSHRVT